MPTSEFDAIQAGLRDALAHAEGESPGGREHEVVVPRVNVAALRESLGMTQTSFAAAFGVSVATLRNWEQGRRVPRGPARVLLNVIAREPEAVRRVLEDLAA